MDENTLESSCQLNGCTERGFVGTTLLSVSASPVAAMQYRYPATAGPQSFHSVTVQAVVHASQYIKKRRAIWINKVENCFHYINS